MNDKEFNELMNFLAKDEEEAIKGYDDVIAKIDDEHVIEQLKKIREEEENHLRFLKEVQEDHELEYVDEHDSEDEVEKASKLFGISLGGNYGR